MSNELKMVLSACAVRYTVHQVSISEKKTYTYALNRIKQVDYRKGMYIGKNEYQTLSNLATNMNNHSTYILRGQNAHLLNPIKLSHKHNLVTYLPHAACSASALLLTKLSCPICKHESLFSII